MDLIIITPVQELIYGITWLEINTPVGNFVIQPGHAPTVLTLAANEKITFCLKNGKRESMPIKQGVVHITRTAATIIMNEP